MKLLFVASYYGENEGGADISTKLLAEGIAQQGNTVEIASINPRKKEGIHSLMAYSPFPTSLIAFLLNTYLLDRLLTKRLLKIINSTHAEIIHVHDIMLLPAAISAAKKAKIPCIITVRDLRFVTNLPIQSMEELSLDFSSKKNYIKYLAREKGWFSALIAFPFIVFRPKRFGNPYVNQMQ